MSKKIIFSAGGTGGHILPALNLMKHFSDNGYEVLIVTDKRGNNLINSNLKYRSYILTAGTLTNKNILRDELIEYCRNPSEQNILILIQDSFGAKNKMMKDLTGIVEPISVAIPFENEMVKWARYFFKNNGLNNVPKDIIETIISFGGDSLYHIKNEILK